MVMEGKYSLTYDLERLGSTDATKEHESEADQDKRVLQIRSNLCEFQCLPPAHLDGNLDHESL